MINNELMDFNIVMPTFIKKKVQALLNTLAFCLSFGTVLVKMGRVYHIFHNPTKMKKVI